MPSRLLPVLVLLLPVLGCTLDTDGSMRGAVTPSADGGTWLAILDGNAGACRQPTVDGVAWPHAIGVAAPVAPGPHRIECGVEMEVDAPAAMRFGVDYWGP